LENIIFKYQLTDSINRIAAGKPLHVAFQKGDLVLWVEHETDTFAVGNDMEIVVTGTGHEFDAEPLDYIGTAVSDTFVWHVYQIKQ